MTLAFFLLDPAAVRVRFCGVQSSTATRLSPNASLFLRQYHSSKDKRAKTGNL